MTFPPGNNWARIFLRIALWFVSLVVGVTLFSAAFILFLSPASVRKDFFGALLLVLLTTMVFALPVACLYLPIVVTFRNADGRRAWVLLVVGALLGPVALLLWTCLRSSEVVLTDVHRMLLGQQPHDRNWIGLILVALVNGTLSSAAYVLSLKVISRRVHLSQSAAQKA